MKSRGHRAYEAYAKALGLEARWHTLTERVRAAWEVAAEAGA